MCTAMLFLTVVLSCPKDYKEHHDNVNVHFVVNMTAKDVEKAEEQGLTEFFKLTSKINTSNMICFDFDGKIKKYSSPEEIIEEFYPRRLAYYQKRKVHTNILSPILNRLTHGITGLPCERIAVAV
jgi:DNA topoisomerase II